MKPRPARAILTALLPLVTVGWAAAAQQLTPTKSLMVRNPAPDGNPVKRRLLFQSKDGPGSPSTIVGHADIISRGSDDSTWSHRRSPNEEPATYTTEIPSTYSTVRPMTVPRASRAPRPLERPAASASAPSTAATGTGQSPSQRASASR